MVIIGLKKYQIKIITNYKCLKFRIEKVRHSKSHLISVYDIIIPHCFLCLNFEPVYYTAHCIIDIELLRAVSVILYFIIIVLVTRKQHV